MITPRQLLHFRLVAALVLGVFSTGAPARADDLAERRSLVAELVAIVPYSDADSERVRVDGVVEGLDKAYPEGLTPYARQQAREAVLESWAKHPPMRQVIVEGLETRLTVDELREAIAFTRSPIAAKIRASPPRIGESDGERLQRALNAEEQAEFMRMIQQPGFQKYMAVLQDAAIPLGQAVASDFKVSLRTRCAAPKEPLPWC